MLWWSRLILWINMGSRAKSKGFILHPAPWLNTFFFPASRLDFQNVTGSDHNRIKPSCGTKALSYPIHQVQAQQCEPIPQAGPLQLSAALRPAACLGWDRLTFENGSWQVEDLIKGWMVKKCPQVTLDFWLGQEVIGPLHRHISEFLGIVITVELREFTIAKLPKGILVLRCVKQLLGPIYYI